MQRLSIQNALVLSDHQLKEIVRHVTDLEKLDVFGCAEITGAGLEDMHKLQRLRHIVLPLDLKSREISSILGMMSTLQHLALYMSDCDIALLRDIATLNDLRTLILRGGGMTPECIDINLRQRAQCDRTQVGSSQKT